MMSVGVGGALAAAPSAEPCGEPPPASWSEEERVFVQSPRLPYAQYRPTHADALLLELDGSPRRGGGQATLGRISHVLVAAQASRAAAVAATPTIAATESAERHGVKVSAAGEGGASVKVKATGTTRPMRLRRSRALRDLWCPRGAALQRPQRCSAAALLPPLSPPPTRRHRTRRRRCRRSWR